MQPNDHKQFLVALIGIAELYDRNLSKPAMGLWIDALEKYDLSAITAALTAHVRSPDGQGQYMPKPADIIRLIEGTSNDAAQLAWAKVDKTLRHFGVWETVVFDDPIIHQVLSDMGGWASLGDKKENEWPFVAKEFQERYRAYKIKGLDSYPAKLIGLHEAENGSKFDVDYYQERQLPLPSPVLIGNPERAQKVLAGGSRGNQLSFTRLPQNLLTAPPKSTTQKRLTEHLALAATAN